MLPIYVQVLNEPVYTDYALPRQFGYSVDDYLKLLRVAHDAMKQVDPQVQIVGGISAGLTSAYTREFIVKGGLKCCDIVDLHIYDTARPAETYEEPFRALEELMKTNGPRRPVWITEWGCYADDDPPNLPLSIGDASMNRCRWPTERAATEHIVKFAATGFAHGVEKIFFHAGTAGRINGPDAGGVLFEYGGAPHDVRRNRHLHEDVQVGHLPAPVCGPRRPARICLLHGRQPAPDRQPAPIRGGGGVVLRAGQTPAHRPGGASLRLDGQRNRQPLDRPRGDAGLPDGPDAGTRVPSLGER